MTPVFSLPFCDASWSTPSRATFHQLTNNDHASVMTELVSRWGVDKSNGLNPGEKAFAWSQALHLLLEAGPVVACQLF